MPSPAIDIKNLTAIDADFIWASLHAVSCNLVTW